MLILISGSSGVGKTTLSKLIKTVLGEDDVVCVSGDDLHKWERGDSIWNTKTHLDPNANNLDVGHSHVVSLKNQIPIARSCYNHDTGKFDSPISITPKRFVIYEGLHALYYKPTTDLADLRIFVDTEESLKTEWKVKRDTKKRGYTESQVLDTMKRRKQDEVSYITPQKDNADVIVKFSRGRNDGDIHLDYVNITDRGWDIMPKVKDFYDSLNEFVGISRWLSLDNSLVQGRGGNVSIKTQSGMIVKSSGYRMRDVNLNHGYSVCRVDGYIPVFSSEDEYVEYLDKSKKGSLMPKPSMEMGLHAILPDRVVIHTHPIHLNAILCSMESRAIIRGLFQDLSYDFLEYTTPGVDLANRIRGAKGIVFLENHGLVASGKDANSVLKMTEDINTRCKKWLGTHGESFVDVCGQERTNLPLFPDAAIFPDEMTQTNNYILRLMRDANLTPKFLTLSDATHLNEMSMEKHRKSMS